jgi:hypothetical protein
VGPSTFAVEVTSVNGLMGRLSHGYVDGQNVAIDFRSAEHALCRRPGSSFVARELSAK